MTETPDDVRPCKHGHEPSIEYEWHRSGSHSGYDDKVRGCWSFSYDCPTPYECERIEAARLMAEVSDR